MVKEAILSQVETINLSDEFRNKKIMRRLLSYLTEKYLAGNADDLKGYTIAIELLGKGERFDANQNAQVRIYVGRLRKSLKKYYLEEGKDDVLLINIPKGSYCLEISSREASNPEIISPQDKIIYDNTISILPFRNLTKSADFDDLVIGLSYELADALTIYQDLKVIRVNSDKNNFQADEIDLLRNKKVSFLISGDIISGTESQVKVSYRLIHSADKSQLWSGAIVFDKEGFDLFEIQKRICDDITSQLGGAYGRVNTFRYKKLIASKPETLSEQALLLKHNHAQTVLTPEIIQRTYNEAYALLELQPKSVLANSLVASINQTIYGQDLPGSRQAYEKFGILSEKAFTLNPNHKLAFTNLGAKCFYYEERDRLFNLFEEGQKWLPYSPLGLGVFGLWFVSIGEFDLGKEIIETVYEKNIFVPSWYHSGLFYYHFHEREYEKALQEAIKFELSGIWQGPLIRVPALAEADQIIEAKEEFERLKTLKPDIQEKGQYLIRLHVKYEPLVEQLLKSYAKIGVELN